MINKIQLITIVITIGLLGSCGSIGIKNQDKMSRSIKTSDNVAFTILKDKQGNKIIIEYNDEAEIIAIRNIINFKEMQKSQGWSDEIRAKTYEMTKNQLINSAE